MVYLISRSPIFSPNSVQRDQAIYRAVCKELQQQGQEVVCITEDDLIADSDFIREDDFEETQAIVSMGRDVRTLKILERYESMGFIVLNSPSALLVNTRSELDNVMARVGIGMKSVSNTTDIEMIESEVGYPLWIKRGDACAQSPEDVQYITERSQLQTALNMFVSRGYEDWILAEHVVGDLIKFYGVSGTNFFHWGYPTKKGGFSKYGQEALNGKPNGYEFSEQRLKELLDQAAEECGMPIYGGDAIVRPDGTIVVVDFNDFPSFGACCKIAATAIAYRTLQ